MKLKDHNSVRCTGNIINVIVVVNVKNIITEWSQTLWMNAIIMFRRNLFTWYLKKVDYAIHNSEFDNGK